MPDTIVRGALRASIQTAAESSKGRFRALVSAYGVKYRIGYALWHTIESGAFAKSIAEQPAFPVYQQHSWSWSELPGIGHASAEESDDEGGLVFDGELYIDDSEAARVVWRQMLAGAIREWSIGYAVIVARRDPDDDMHEFVTEGELLEASAVLRGANPQTKTLQVASATPGTTRITTASGVIVETADAELIARLTTAGGAPAPAPAPAPEIETAGDTEEEILARFSRRELFGSNALADATS